MNLGELTQGERFLVEWQYYMAGSFETALAKVIAIADKSNLDKLALGFPEEVEAYRRYAYESGYWDSVQKKAGR